MSDIYEKMKSELNKGAEIVSSKSKSILEITKLNSEIDKLNQEKSAAILELGECVYALFYYDNLSIDEITARCQEIKLIDNSIEYNNDLIKSIQEEERRIADSFIPNKCLCGADLRENAKFCTKCGMKIEDIKQGIIEQQEETAEKIPVRLCQCGCEIEDGMQYCYNCGSKLEPGEESEPIVNETFDVFVCDCGNEIKKGANFCKKCGKRVDKMIYKHL